MKMNDERILYDFYNMELNVVEVFDRQLAINDVRDITDTLLAFNPTMEELKLLIDLNKKVVTMFTYIEEDCLELLKSDNVQEVLVFDDLDALFLSKRLFKKFKLVKPFNPFAEDIVNNEEINDVRTAAICYENLYDLLDVEGETLRSVPNFGLSTFYSGYKVIKKKSDFGRLMNILYSQVGIKEYPLFSLRREIGMLLYTISFPKRGFPIIPAFTSAIGNIPIIFSERYYKWILAELQNPSKEDMEKICNSSDKVEEIRNEQKKLFLSYFGSRPDMKEVLADYVSTNT
jgi:hypothetical protein